MSRPAWRTPQAWVPAALVLLFLTGAMSCARHTQKSQDVVFWVAWPVSAVEPLARRFEAENPGLRVVLVQLPWSSGADSVAAAVKAGTPPDLCQLHDSQLPPLMVGSSLSDWSAGVADLRPRLRGWDMCMVGDAIYGLPWLVRTQVLYYNKALLGRAGADSAHAPETWDELRSAATRVQRLRGGVHGYGMPAGPDEDPLALLLPFASGGHGDSIAVRKDAARLDIRLDVTTLETLQALRAVGLVASRDSLEQEFANGRLGMLLAGSELAARLTRTTPALRFGLALVPEASAAGSAHVSVAGGEALVSFTGSRRKEDALKLARFLVGEENARGLATALGTVQPATLGADTAAWYRARPEQQIIFRQYETARFLPNFRERLPLADTLRALLDDALSGRRSVARVASLADSFISTHLGQR